MEVFKVPDSMENMTDDRLLVEVDTRYGRVYAFQNDSGVSRAILHYGEWAQREINFLLQFIDSESVVVDVGAYIGTHTMAFATKASAVLSFEPNPYSFQLLKRNTSALYNVKIYNVALANSPGTFSASWLPPETEGNFGSIGLNPAHDGANTVDNVQASSLDAIYEQAGISRCDLVKVDVEGFEEAVIRGGLNVIKLHYPYVYAECNSLEAGLKVINVMSAFGYDALACSIEAYNMNNYRAEAENIFAEGREIGLLLIPPGKEFHSRSYDGVDIFPIRTADDLAAAMLTKPQYKTEVLWLTTASSFIQNKENADIERYREQVADKEHDIERYREQVADKEHAIERYIEQVAEKEHAIERYREQVADKEHAIERYIEQVAEKEHEIEQLRNDLQESWAEAKAQGQEILKKSQELDELQREIVELHVSRSWRYTRPVRRFMRLIRRIWR
jgi:FkbM family methyltransferase